jgi:hypothetical protein
MRLGLSDETVAKPTRTTSSVSPPTLRHLPSSASPSPLLYIALTLPFLGLLAWLGIFFYHHQMDSEMSRAERPIFSQFRPLQLQDLNPILLRSMTERFKPPVELRLERYRGRELLTVYSDHRAARRRAVIVGDLDEAGILRRYSDKTGDQADTVELRSHHGRPYVYIYSSEDAADE